MDSKQVRVTKSDFLTTVCENVGDVGEGKKAYPTSYYSAIESLTARGYHLKLRRVDNERGRRIEIWEKGGAQ